jgi:hypothetical protein
MQTVSIGLPTTRPKTTGMLDRREYEEES